MKMHRTITTSLAFLIISASGIAIAGPESKEHKDKDLLKGPAVVNNDTTTRNNRPMDSRMDPETDSMKDKDHRAPPPMYRDYLFALRQMTRGQDNPLNLTDAQHDQILTIMREHREAMKAFQEKNRDRMRQMREQAGNRKDEMSQKKPDEERQTIEQDHRPQRDRVRQGDDKLRAFIDNAPPNKEALAKLKQVLTPEQMHTLKTHIRKLQRERRQRLIQRPDQRPDRVERPRRESELETDRQRTPRKRVDRDRVRDTSKENTQRSKRDKKDKPGSDDD